MTDLNAPGPDPTYQTLIHRIKAVLRGKLADMPALLDTVDLELAADRAGNDLAATIRYSVMVEECPTKVYTDTAERTERVEWYTPATWWDHLKHTHGHQWWLRWWARRRPAVLDHHCEEVRFMVQLAVAITPQLVRPFASSGLPYDQYGRYYLQYDTPPSAALTTSIKRMKEEWQ